MRNALLTILGLVAACGNDVRIEVPTPVDRFPRLSHAQWESTVQDLFSLPTPTGLSATFQPDPQIGRFDNNISRLGLTSALWRDYQRAAEAIAERVATDPALVASLMPDAASVNPSAFVSSFGARAFRRPLTRDEVLRYVQLFEDGMAHPSGRDSTAAGVRLVVQAMLQSPHFLYRAELSEAVEGRAIRLGGYEIASRMSYLFWNTMPDDELFAAAKAGDLDGLDGIRRQAARMMKDPRARDQLSHFHVQTFAMSDYADVDKDTTTFPRWRRDIGKMMYREALQFVEWVVASGGGISDMLTSTVAFVNADLAELYGLHGTFGDAYQEVQLDSTQRAGLLTRVGFLARNSTLDESDPIHRGVFVNLRVICRAITAPPALPSMLERTGNTTRERVDSVTGEGTCGEGCHAAIINPVGYAFEHYDALGMYRAQENGFLIDSSDTYAFADGDAIAYKNAVELSEQLALSPEVHECYARNLLEFMLGRDLRASDEPIVHRLRDDSLMRHASSMELAVSVVTSDAFRTRPLRSGP